MTEDELLIGVTDLLTAGKWRWVHFRRSDKAKMMGHAGLPDIIAVSSSRHRLIFAELKGSHGRTEPEQRDWLFELEDVAGVRIDVATNRLGFTTGPRLPEVYLWRPLDWLNGTIDRALR